MSPDEYDEVYVYECDRCPLRAVGLIRKAWEWMRAEHPKVCRGGAS